MFLVSFDNIQNTVFVSIGHDAVDMALKFKQRLRRQRERGKIKECTASKGTFEKVLACRFKSTDEGKQTKVDGRISATLEMT